MTMEAIWNSNTMKGLVSKARSLAMGVSEIELKVLEATNEDPWGPHGSVMTEIARASEDFDKYTLIMTIINQRLDEREENWRLCYKALLLLDFLIKQGPPRLIPDLKRNQRTLEGLREDFDYKDIKGVDQGVNVRARARDLIALFNDPGRIQEERERASKNAGKYTGTSSSDAPSRMTGSRGGGGNSGGGGGGGGGGGFSGSAYTTAGYSGGGGGGGGSSSRDRDRDEGSSKGGSSGYDAPPSKSSHGAKTQPSSTSRGAGATSSSGRTRASDAGEEDPFEATRKRIERLKNDGALLGPPQPAVNIDPALLDQPVRAPRKLKDVKVIPGMAAMFANLTLTSAGSISSSGTPGAPTPGASSTALELLGEEDAPAPAKAFGGMLAPPPGASRPTAAPPPPAPAAAAADSADMWGDMLSVAAPQAAAAPPAAEQDPWASFASRPSTQAPQPTASASFAAPSMGARQEPLSLLDFGDSHPTPAPQPQPVPPPAPAPSQPASMDPFLNFSMAPAPQYAPAAAAAPAFEFAPAAGAPGGALMALGGGAAKQQLSSASQAAAARAKDPFAGLGF